MSADCSFVLFSTETISTSSLFLSSLSWRPRILSIVKLGLKSFTGEAGPDSDICSSLGERFCWGIKWGVVVY